MTTHFDYAMIIALYKYIYMIKPLSSLSLAELLSLCSLFKMLIAMKSPKLKDIEGNVIHHTFSFTQICNRHTRQNFN